MKHSIFIITTAILILFSSCSDESQMNRTVFIPDETNSSLPAYTEWGYNSFGAIYDIRDYFVVSSYIVPCKILYKDGLLRFSLSGVLKGNYYFESEKTTLSFNFPWDKPMQYTDLLVLHDIKLDLASDGCVVNIIRGENEQTLKVIDGTLHFKRAQLLYIDEVPNRVILSGIFELRFLENDFPTSISEGRFDVGINKDVFFAY